MAEVRELPASFRVLFKELPPWYPSPLERLKLAQKVLALSRRTQNLRNMRAEMRPASLLAMLTPVRISSSSLTPVGKLVYKDVSYFSLNDTLSWDVTYQNQTRAPMRFSYEQGIDGVVSKEENVSIEGKEAIPVLTPYSVSSAKVLDAYAKVKQFVRVTDSARKRFNIGVLDYRLRPASDFPITGAQTNSDISPATIDDVIREFRGLTSRLIPVVYNMQDSWSGVSSYGGVLFRHPDESASVTRHLSFKNNSAVESYILTLSYTQIYMPYENPSLISGITGATDRTKKLSPGEEWVVELPMALPDWMYGRVLILTASMKMPDWCEFHIGDYKVGLMRSP